MTTPTTAPRRWWLSAAACVAVACGLNPAPAQPLADPPADGPATAVRRVFVPADRPEVWPTGGQRFLPIEAARLRRLLAEEPRGDTQASSLTLDARWADGELVGEGRLRFDTPGPAFVPWPESTLVVSEPRWRPAASGEPSPESADALLGWWPAAEQGGAGRRGLAAPGAGELRFGFRCRRAEPRRPATAFVFKLPAALRRSVRINAPSWARFSGEGLLVEPPRPAPGEQGRTEWRVEAPPGNELTLIATDTRPNPGTLAAGVSVAEQTSVEVRPDAAAARSRLELSSTARLPKRLRVAADGGLLLESAELDGEPLAVTPSPMSTDGATHLIELPTNRQRRAVLIVEGVAPVRPAAGFLLPRVRLLGADWSEGTLTATLDAGLRVDDLLVERDATLLPPSLDRRVFAFRLLGSRAGVQLLAAPTTSRVATSLRHEVRLGVEADEASVAVEVASVTGPAPTTLAFAVGRGWRIDSVEADPPALLDRWEVEGRGEHRRLRLRLTEEATGLAGATLDIRAQRRDRPTTATEIPLRRLRAVAPIDSDTALEQMLIRAAPTRAVAPWGVSTRRLAAAREQPEASGAPAEQGTRLEARPSSAADLAELDLTGMSDEEWAAARLKVFKRRAPLEVALSVEAIAADDRGRIGYRCRGGFGGERRAATLAVRFDAPLPATTVWSDQRGRPLRVVETADDGRLWRVRPIGGGDWSGFVAVAELPPAGATPVPLAAVVGAASQSGAATLGPTVAAQGWVDLRGPEPTPVDESAPADAAAYRYDPRRLIDNAAGSGPTRASLVVRRASAEGPNAGALRLLVTRCDADGVARHTAEYAGVTPGNGFTFRLPRGAKLLGVEDAAGGGLTASRLAKNTWSVAPARAMSAAALRVRYLTERDAFRDGARLGPAPPTRPTPPATFAWRVEPPIGWSVETPSTPRPTLVERLFGDRCSWPRWGPAAQQKNGGAVEVLAAADQSEGVRLIHEDTQTGRTLIAIVAAAIVAATLIDRWPRLWGVGLAVALAGALVAPLAAGGWAPAAWIGWLLGPPLALVAGRLAEWSRRRSRPAAPVLERQTTAVGKLLSVLLITAVALASPSAAAAPPPEMVLTPIDDQREPVGDKVYVREAWLSRLLADDARNSRALPSDALVRSANCRGVLLRAAGGGLDTGRWTMRLELTTFARSTLVALPLRRADAEWAPTATVDGQSTPIVWAASGVGCSVRVEEPGDTRVEIRFRPKVQASGDEACVRLALCPAGAAGLSIAFPADHPGPRTPRLASRSSRNGDKGRLAASLAAADELVVCWPNEPDQPPPPRAEVDLLEWVRVSPDGVYLDVEAKPVVPGAGLVDVDYITPDGGERFDPPTAAGSGEGPTPLRAAFRLPRAAVEGVVRPPAIVLRGGSVRSRSMALSVDGRYAWSLDAGRDAQPLSADDFLQRWAAPPGLAPDIDRALLLTPNAAPEITIRPNAKNAVTDQRLRLTAGPQRTVCRYAATHPRRAAASGLLAYRVAREMRVTGVRVSANGEPIESRWTRPRRGRLVVFYPPPTSGRLEVEIDGEAPTPGNNEHNAPTIAAWAEEAPLEVTLARDDTALVTTTGAGWSPAPVDEEADGTLIATATHRADDPPLALRVSGNPAEVRLESVSRFEGVAEGGPVTWLARGVVTSGELGRLPIVVAPGFTLNPAEEPAGARYEAAPRVGETDGWIVLPRPLPAGAEFALRLTATPSSDALAEPIGPPLSVAVQPPPRTIVALPPSGADSPGSWRSAEIKPVPPPDWLVAAGGAVEGERFFEHASNGGPIKLRWKPHRRTGAAPLRASLADHRIAIGPEGGATTRSTLVIDPRGALSCRFRLPDSHRLLAVRVDGAPAPVRSESKRVCEVAMRDPRAKSVVELLTCGPLDASVAVPEPLDANGDAATPATTLYEIGVADARAVVAAEGTAELTTDQLAAARRHVEESSSLRSESPNRWGFDTTMAACPRRVALMADGPHAPPVVRRPWAAAAALRYAAAGLIVGAALMGATRELWRPRWL